MAADQESDFLAGVVEGFYGQPWSHEERLELFDWMAAWSLNTYLYAPKDDLHQRVLWREPYPAAQAQQLRELFDACNKRRLQSFYAISPGLDIRYASNSDLERLIARLEEVSRLGCRNFALLFDDIAEQMDSGDVTRFDSLASAQVSVANSVFRWLRERGADSRFVFCPTAYCDRMAQQQLGGSDYLATLGRALLTEIDVFWTGPEIVSKEITLAQVKEMQSILRRKPLIWDNLHANDYDGHRFFCGPYAGRPPELIRETRGLLSNPNNEFLLNQVPLRTLADFVRCETNWDPRKSYIPAMREWLARFEVSGDPLSIDDLVLFGDCYYLPHKEGPEADALFEEITNSLAGNTLDSSTKPFSPRAIRLREFCTRLMEMRDRNLFYALSRRIWDLREELDLLERYAKWSRESRAQGTPFSSHSHLPGTYRGGMVARLQRLLVQEQDGTLVATTNKPAML
jgi:hypothetical protein